MLRRLASALVAVAVLVTPLLALPGTAAAESQTVCAGQSNVPTGWIHTDSYYTPFVCGAGGTPPFPTQWLITRYDTARRGDQLSVCADAPTPAGWTVVQTYVEYFRCGLRGFVYPGPPPNIRLIECLNCPPPPPPPPTPTPCQGSIDAIFPTGVVGGWARDPGNLGGTVAVHFYVDGPAGAGRFLGVAQANQYRSDVGQHAYSWTLPADVFDDAQHPLYAYCIDITGDQPAALTNSPRSFRLPKRPLGALEAVEATGTVRGWSLDPSLAGYSRPNRVRFLVDSFAVGEAVADLPRPDVQASTGYPGEHGFRWPIPTRFRDGTVHTLSAVGVDLTGDADRELTGSPTTFQLTRGRVAADVDGDRISDVGLWRPSTATWWLRPSGASGGHYAVTFGLPGDRPVPADYDGDGRTDPAVFRPSEGMWYVLPSGGAGAYGVQFGVAEDRPLPGDYDSDGTADLAVFRPSDSTWYIRRPDGSFYGMQYGTTGDLPVPADYDGDRRTDVAVYRPNVNGWFVLNSSTGATTVAQYGAAGDRLAPADYDGDTLADIAVYRPSQGTWYVHRSLDGRDRAVAWGASGDLPVAADYDGDGLADLAVFRPSDGTWWIVQSSTGATVSVQFGASGDVPLAAALLPA